MREIALFVAFRRFVDHLVNVFRQWQRETDRSEL